MYERIDVSPGAIIYFEYWPSESKLLESNSKGDFADKVYGATLGLISI